MEESEEILDKLKSALELVENLKQESVSAKDTCHQYKLKLHTFEKDFAQVLAENQILTKEKVIHSKT